MSVARLKTGYDPIPDSGLFAHWFINAVIDAEDLYEIDVTSMSCRELEQFAKSYIERCRRARQEETGIEW